MKIRLRTALMTDCSSIETLIAGSIRKLGALDYSADQIESALTSAFGLDTQLITDQTYFMVESGRLPIACGGWSFRETLFGSDAEQNRDSQRINPSSGAAKIRAFFVDPDFARMGIGSMIMVHCEQEALRAGFRKLELMATLSGIKLYEHHGFVAGEPIQYSLGDRLTIEFVPMFKQLSAVE
jgi:GNAT superfamily N-acetyltransferase